MTSLAPSWQGETMGHHISELGELDTVRGTMDLTGKQH